MHFRNSVCGLHSLLQTWNSNDLLYLSLYGAVIENVRRIQPFSNDKSSSILWQLYTGNCYCHARYFRMMKTTKLTKISNMLLSSIQCYLAPHSVFQYFRRILIWMKLMLLSDHIPNNMQYLMQYVLAHVTSEIWKISKISTAERVNSKLMLL